jgi:hypothetical protein
MRVMLVAFLSSTSKDLTIDRKFEILLGVMKF